MAVLKCLLIFCGILLGFCAALCPEAVGRSPSGPSLPSTGGNWLNLMTNNIFPCPGKVIGWRYQRGNENTIAVVGVWRSVGNTRRKFKLVGKSSLMPDKLGVVSVRLTEPIEVQEGDVIGVQYSKNVRHAAIRNAKLQELPAREMFATYNAGIFDEHLPVGKVINVDPKVSVPRTYALQAIMEGDVCSNRDSEKVCLNRINIDADGDKFASCHSTVMMKNCKETCGLCDPIPPSMYGDELGLLPDCLVDDKLCSPADMEKYTEPMPPTTDFKPTKMPNPECTDKSLQCQSWAAAGFCVFPIVTTRKCQRTCGLCACFDEHIECKDLEQKGHCESEYSEYMKINCRKSCKTCLE